MKKFSIIAAAIALSVPVAAFAADCCAEGTECCKDKDKHEHKKPCCANKDEHKHEASPYDAHHSHHADHQAHEEPKN